MTEWVVADRSLPTRNVDSPANQTNRKQPKIHSIIRHFGLIRGFWFRHSGCRPARCPNLEHGHLSASLCGPRCVVLYYLVMTTLLGGEPIIAGTRTSVRAIVEMWRAGIAPEEIPARLPHLKMAQVFDALSYFSDHQEEVAAHIERNKIPDSLLGTRRLST